MSSPVIVTRCATSHLLRTIFTPTRLHTLSQHWRRMQQMQSCAVDIELTSSSFLIHPYHRSITHHVRPYFTVYSPKALSHPTRHCILRRQLIPSCVGQVMTVAHTRVENVETRSFASSNCKQVPAILSFCAGPLRPRCNTPRRLTEHMHDSIAHELRISLSS